MCRLPEVKLQSLLYIQTDGGLVSVSLNHAMINIQTGTDECGRLIRGSQNVILTV